MESSWRTHMTIAIPALNIRLPWPKSVYDTAERIDAAVDDLLATQRDLVEATSLNVVAISVTQVGAEPSDIYLLITVIMEGVS